MAFSSFGSLLAAAAVAALLFIITGAVYRVYFSRNSHIPGPKLAALTYLYQSYYDIYPYQGQWLFHQIELHKQYGPVVRVGPDEIHIDNPDFYNEFAGTSKQRRDKSATWYWFSDMDQTIGLSAFATLDHDRHAHLRSAMNGFFAKRKVQELEDRVKVHVKKMTSRLLEYKATGELVNLLSLASALTLDVISEYSFGKSVDCLDTRDLGAPLRAQLESGVQLHPVARQFRLIIRAMLRGMAYASAKFGIPKEFRKFDDMVADLTDPAYQKAMQEGEGKSATETSIVEAMYHSKILSPAEKTQLRIRAEAGNLVGAGTETTARTLAVGLFYVLNDPDIHSRLLAEIRTFMPTANSDIPSVVELTKLPYLTACLHETTRIAHGVAGRLVRISPDKDLFCNNVRTPKGSTFSVSHYIQHTNPKIFPEPFAFKPDRFLGEKSGEAFRYLVAFGKGPRMCLGMNLAWSEMCLSLVALIGGVDMELVGTTVEDVTVRREYFLGLFPKESKGIRARVNGLQK
ncbi:hypothetical protein PRZ48_009746 [Zasmidium cellare]|uniref:Cytochrome P450 n=1 Tax=Zasmidium cellare TaxID=395010 RepID=A0ABR0EDG8_ZASCE|nr:hypothetical protein PRZ48_009746 [Zasmidium cellare]